MSFLTKARGKASKVDAIGLKVVTVAIVLFFICLSLFVMAIKSIY